MDYLDEIADELAGRYRKQLRKDVAATAGEYTITARKHYKGVDCGAEEILLTQFDDIVVYPEHHFAALNVNNRLALYDLQARQAVSPFQFTNINIMEGRAILTADNGLSALYDVAERRYVVREPTFVEYDLCNVDTEYLAGKHLDGSWSFISCTDYTRMVHIYDIELPYHTAHGIFARVSSTRVCAFDHKGIARPELLRAEVLKYGGYLQLNNHSSNICDHIDVYGNILNI